MWKSISPGEKLIGFLLFCIPAAQLAHYLAFGWFGVYTRGPIMNVEGGSAWLNILFYFGLFAAYAVLVYRNHRKK